MRAAAGHPQERSAGRPSTSASDHVCAQTAKNCRCVVVTRSGGPCSSWPRPCRAGRPAALVTPLLPATRSRWRGGCGRDATGRAASGAAPARTMPDRQEGPLLHPRREDRTILPSRAGKRYDRPPQPGRADHFRGAATLRTSHRSNARIHGAGRRRRTPSRSSALASPSQAPSMCRSQVRTPTDQPAGPRGPTPQMYATTSTPLQRPRWQRESAVARDAPRRSRHPAPAARPTRDGRRASQQAAAVPRRRPGRSRPSGW
jgi:hypothetical protein